MECNTCKKTDHLEVACMQELQKQGPSKQKEQKFRTVQEDSDSSTGEEDNFKKVSYLSGARKLNM